MRSSQIIGIAALIGAAAQVFSETLGSGTHDIQDAVYGIGSMIVGLSLYSALRKQEFGVYRKLWDTKELARSESSTIKPGPIKKPVHKNQARAKRKQQNQSRRHNRRK